MDVVVDALAQLAQRYDSIAQSLQTNSLVIVDNALPRVDCERIRQSALSTQSQGILRPAKIGASANARISEFRTDQITWLTESDASLRIYFEPLHALRRALNQQLFLGLQDVEAHFACFPPGASYARHLDRFSTDDARVLSSVYYLNEDWREAEGGQLRIHLAKDEHLDIWPVFNRLVLFLSAELEHEVMPASRERFSVAGWFRRTAIRPG
jgi:SM-20-related protein